MENVHQIVSYMSCTKLPNDMGRFWSSGQNKTKLQNLFKTWVTDHKGFERFSASFLVLSALLVEGKMEKCRTIKKAKGLFKGLKRIQTTISFGHTDQNNPKWEEADIRIIPHALDAATQARHRRLMILSEDTDIFVIFLYFWHRLQRQGAWELWMRRITKDGADYSPLHTIAHKLGAAKCMVLPALHTLTGCDTTSKVGTKNSAVNEALVDKKGNMKELWQELRGFGETESDLVLENQFKKAENFLVKVYKAGTELTTMDDLRNLIYHQSDTKTLEDLPPTSHSLRDHIKRAFYITFQQVHCLDSYNYNLNPTEYGYEKLDGKIMPVNSNRPLPDDLPLCCTCVKCARRTCLCKASCVSCISFCKCQGPPKTCQSEFMTLQTTIDLSKNK